MLLDLSCPVELLDFELTPDDHNKVRAYIRLNSTAERRVELIEGEIYWLNSRTGARTEAAFIADQLVAAPNSPFKLQLSTEELPGADLVEVIFTRIGFAGGERDWSLDRSKLVSIEPPLPPRGSELNMLLHACGSDAENFPLSTSDYWFCVCGRPNEHDTGECARCRRSKHEVLTRFTRKAVVGGETPPMYTPNSTGEVPDFLYAESRAERDARARGILSGLMAHRTRQRNVLIRRSVFILVSVILCAAIVSAVGWLGEKQQQALDSRVPTKLESR